MPVAVLMQSITLSRNSIASRTSCSRSEVMTIVFGFSSRATSRAACKPTIPAPPRMRTVSAARIVRLANPLFLTLWQIPSFGDPLVRQPALAVERRLAAGAGGGDGLAIDVIDDVAAGENALNVRDRRV